jgi:phenylacetic acid degradation operon negative regulatory protein
MGRDEAAIRQTLYRMENDGELSARKAGRTKWYRPSSYADAEIDAGTEKIFERPPGEWDGAWTIVRVGLRSRTMASQRERVIALLAVEGFAQLDANLFIHPRSRADRLQEALTERAKSDVLIFRGPLLSTHMQATLASHWNVTALASRYRRVGNVLSSIDDRLQAGITDREAFMLRFAVVFEYLGVAWDDPDLPDEVLPTDWPAPQVRTAAARLYDRLLPAAVRHADELLARVSVLKTFSTKARS